MNVNSVAAKETKGMTVKELSRENAELRSENSDLRTANSQREDRNRELLRDQDAEKDAKNDAIGDLMAATGHVERDVVPMASVKALFASSCTLSTHYLNEELFYSKLLKVLGARNFLLPTPYSFCPRSRIIILSSFFKPFLIFKVIESLIYPLKLPRLFLTF